MTMSGSYGGPGPAINPNLVGRMRGEDGIAAPEPEVEEASEGDVAEQAAATSRLDDPEVSEAIEDLKPASD